MPIFSNVDDMLGPGSWLEDTINGFRFDLPGIHESIGYDCAIAVAEGIQERSLVEQRGATEVWPANSADYLEYKIEHYNSDRINARTGQMLSMHSLTADIQIEDHGETVVMTYGTGEAPGSSLTGHLEPEDEETTDKEKAAIAHANGRSFFEIDQNITNTKVLPIIRDCLGEYLQERANR